LRPLAVAGLYLLGVANGITVDVVRTIAKEGFSDALMDTFGVSVILIAAAIVGLKLAARTPDRPIDRWDWFAGAFYLSVLCVPASPAGMAALTFLAGYEALRHVRNPEAVAAACLFIGIAACNFWSPLVLNLFASDLLTIEAALVAKLLNVIQGGGAEHAGNLVETVRGQPLLIMSGCSSLTNMLYGLLCWMAIVRAYRPAWRPADLLSALSVAVLTVAMNTLRLALMGTSREAYFLLHSPVGALVVNSFILIVAIAAAWRTVAAQTPAARASVV
jgi:hypothetical protein